MELILQQTVFRKCVEVPVMILAEIREHRVPFSVLSELTYLSTPRRFRLSGTLGPL